MKYNLNKGDYVVHYPTLRRGIVKDINGADVLVVFDWKGEQFNYENYPAQKINLEDLESSWTITLEMRLNHFEEYPDFYDYKQMKILVNEFIDEISNYEDIIDEQKQEIEDLEDEIRTKR